MLQLKIKGDLIGGFKKLWELKLQFNLIFVIKNTIYIT